MLTTYVILNPKANTVGQCENRVWPKLGQSKVGHGIWRVKHRSRVRAITKESANVTNKSDKRVRVESELNQTYTFIADII